MFRERLMFSWVSPKLYNSKRQREVGHVSTILTHQSDRVGVIHIFTLERSYNTTFFSSNKGTFWQCHTVLGYIDDVWDFLSESDSWRDKIFSTWHLISQCWIHSSQLCSTTKNHASMTHHLTPPYITVFWWIIMRVSLDSKFINYSVCTMPTTLQVTRDCVCCSGLASSAGLCFSVL